MTEFAATLPGGPARQVAHLHIAFNLALLVLGLPLTGLAARALTRAFPDPDPATARHARPPRRQPARPPGARAHRGHALGAHARRHRRDHAAQKPADLATGDEAEIEQVRTLEQTVDTAQEEIAQYLVRLMRAKPDEETQTRVAQLLLFTANLEHVGDIIDKGLLSMAQKKHRLDVDFSPAGATSAACTPACSTRCASHSPCSSRANPGSPARSSPRRTGCATSRPKRPSATSCGCATARRPRSRPPRSTSTSCATSSASRRT